MQQRRVLITGAGSGLGRALAFCFAENGWRVACADINIDSANEYWNKSNSLNHTDSFGNDLPAITHADAGRLG